jgi:hypothetical protein
MDTKLVYSDTCYYYNVCIHVCMYNILNCVIHWQQNVDNELCIHVSQNA